MEAYMKVVHPIDKYFWVSLVVAISSGFLLPNVFSVFQDWVVYIIMAMLFLVFVKIDIKDVVHHVKSPLLLLYVVGFNLLLMPALIYFLFANRIDPETAMGLVLLAALPCGVSSVAFTDIMEGHTSLTLTIILVSTLLAPFTIPFIFWALYNTNLDLNYVEFLKSLLTIIMIPAALSQIFKHMFEDFVSHTQRYVNFSVILLISFNIMIVISLHAEYILAHIKESLPILGILYLMFFLLQILGYFSVFWLNKGEKVAVANSNIIMNNMLGVVLAMAFFSPKIVMVIVLSILPWNTVVIIFHWFKKYLP